MNPAWGIPPKSKAHLTPSKVISERLTVLIGQEFPLTRKTRTDGSMMRKLVARTLETHGLPEESSNYSILSEKGKGIPRLTREYIDTYIVTSGESYNLQVWNRIPTNNDPQIEYEDGSSLCASDVRFVLVRVDVKSYVITTVLVLTPDYIESNFGPFGSPTLKHQLIITNKKRQEIIGGNGIGFCVSDTKKIQDLCVEEFVKPTKRFNQWPTSQGEILSAGAIMIKAGLPLVHHEIKGAETKNRGQILERLVLEKLGYSISVNESLEGQYPDIKHQLLEVKIQDSPTIDLGKYTPLTNSMILPELEIRTKDVRYLIVLMNPKSNKVEGVVLMPGEALGVHFRYVDGISGKSQRAIKMNVFERYKGLSVFNPLEENA